MRTPAEISSEAGSVERELREVETQRKALRKRKNAIQAEWLAVPEAARKQFWQSSEEVR